MKAMFELIENILQPNMCLGQQKNPINLKSFSL